MDEVIERKPGTRDGYPPGLAEEARRMALLVATVLGDLNDQVVIVGGLVPYLIVDQERVPKTHVGTRDLDLGLSRAVLDDERYREISARLRDRGFEPCRTPEGAARHQTWRLRDERITLDFLIGAINDEAQGGRLQHLDSDLAAIVTPALPVAFDDCLTIVVDDVTPDGERARREILVAGPAAFVVLKAHAFRYRGENKDAYDLVYVLMNFGSEPVTPVVERFALIAEHAAAQEALSLLEEDFASADHLGPRRWAAFFGEPASEVLRQDAAGAVQAFLAGVRALSRR